MTQIPQDDLAAPLSAAAPGPWRDHPRFAGVRLRLLAGGDQTDGRFSTYLVAIAPGQGMDSHRHDAQVEQHLVIAGTGTLTRGGAVQDYRRGSLAILSQGLEHSVWAGDDGMMLIALFAPALE